MQFEVNCLEEMSDDNLKELSAALVTRVKEAKKKVSAFLKKDSHLTNLWVTKLGLDPPKALPEEVMEIRNKRKKDFEIALLSNPEAFIAFQTSAFLVSLHEVIRAEKTRRTPVKK